MRYIIIGIILTFFIASTSQAFELDGFKSGMSIQDAQKKLEAYSYKNIKVEGNNITAYYQSANSLRLFNLNFCKGVLVQVQKELDPSYSRFVRVIDEKRFITRKRTFELKGVDIPAFLNLKKENRKGSGHVHEYTVSRVWDCWVSVCSC